MGRGRASLTVSLGLGHTVPVTSLQPTGNFFVCSSIKTAFPLSL